MKTKKLKNKSGFTLVEVLISIGPFVLIGALISFVDMDSFRGESFRSEISTIGTALQTARANSFNNINQKRHGVAFNPNGFNGYVIFEGSTFSNRDTTKDVTLSSSYVVTFSPGSPSEIVFEQLSGDTNFNGAITITDQSREISTVISINNEGKIAW